MKKRVIVVVSALVLVSFVWFVRLITETPPIILLVAVVPALCYSGLLVLIDRYEREPGHLLFVAFFWGAVIAAFFSSTVNDYLHAWVAGIGGEDRASSLAPVLVAPLVEEVSKAVALLILLLFWREEFDNVTDGIVYGALVGVGFAMTENFSYFTLAAVQGGPSGLVQSIYLRSFLGGFNHAAFTASAGAGFGYAREALSAKTRVLAPILGLTGAVLQHIAWNAFASQMITEVLCNQGFPGGPCQPAPTTVGLLVVIPLIVAAFIGPGGLTLLVLAVLALHREASVIAMELQDEVRRGVLTPEEYARLSSIRGRLAGEWHVLRAHGFRSWLILRRMHHTATELAFCRWRRRRGGNPAQSQQVALEDKYREELTKVRLATVQAEPKSKR